MLSLIEELTENDSIFILMESTKQFLYGEYKVIKTKYTTMKNQYALLILQNNPKKARYFKKKIELKGYRIDFNYTPKTYIVFDDFDDLIRHFCKTLKQTPDNNLKLIEKFKKKYPSYFHERLY